MADISNVIKSTGVQLENEAYRQFGAAVQDQVRGQLGTVFRTDQSAPGTISAEAAARNIRPGGYNPTKYAANITSGAGGYNPKTKFLFKVKFSFVPEIGRLLSTLNNSILKDLNEKLTYVVKQIDLPKVQMDYEDVNLYNFKTKILTNTSFREVNLSFYDDVSNTSLSFINTYFQLLVPITRNRYPLRTRLEDYGFSFTQALSKVNTSLRGHLPDNNSQIISEMIIEQFYFTFDQNVPKPIDAYKVNQFTFTNPRITTLDISDQDYENGSAANIVSVIMNFDSINMAFNKDASDRISPGITGADIFDGTNILQSAQARNPAGNAKNPFIDIVAAQGQRTVQTTVAGALNRSVGTIAGGALGGVISDVSGTLGSIARKTIKDVSTGISQGSALPSTPTILRDNSSPREVTNSVTTVSANVS